MSGSSIAVPSREQFANYPPALADALVALATSAKADLDELLGGSSTVLPTYTARAVITSIAAYAASGGVITANSVGAIGAQDGVTLVAGDQVFLPEGTAAAAADAGPYVVTSPGGAGKFVLTRPSWWATGQAIPQGKIVEVGGEGTLFAGSSWKTFVAKAKLVDTDAPAFWPRKCGATVALSSGQYDLGATEGLFLRSTTKSQVSATRNTIGGTITTTILYACPVANRTAGVTGTGAVRVQAEVAAGTVQASDTSTVDVTVLNW